MTVLWEPALDDEARRWLETAKELNLKHFAPLAAEIDRDQRYPWENVEELVQAAESGESHPVDVAFGVRVVELLASAQAQLTR